MAYDKSVICWKQYEETFKGKLFADSSQDQFTFMFEKSQNTKGKPFLQDGDPW